jgi:hypothetical protein
VLTGEALRKTAVRREVMARDLSYEPVVPKWPEGWQAKRSGCPGGGG